jgi:hypothetical protein
LAAGQLSRGSGYDHGNGRPLADRPPRWRRQLDHPSARPVQINRFGRSTDLRFGDQVHVHGGGSAGFPLTLLVGG